jgi:hypothetical protein
VLQAEVLVPLPVGLVSVPASEVQGKQAEAVEGPRARVAALELCLLEVVEQSWVPPFCHNRLRVVSEPACC